MYYYDLFWSRQIAEYVPLTFMFIVGGGGIISDEQIKIHLLKMFVAIPVSRIISSSSESMFKGKCFVTVESDILYAVAVDSGRWIWRSRVQRGRLGFCGCQPDRERCTILQLHGWCNNWKQTTKQIFKLGRSLKWMHGSPNGYQYRKWNQQSKFKFWQSWGVYFYTNNFMKGINSCLLQCTQ